MPPPPKHIFGEPYHCHLAPMHIMIDSELRLWAGKDLFVVYTFQEKDDDKKNNQMGIMGRKVLQKKSLFATKLIWKNRWVFSSIHSNSK